MPALIHETRHLIAVDEDQLAAVVTLAEGADSSRMAVLLHGGPGGQKEGPDNLYVDLAKRLADAGIASVRFDFRGCGESSGRYRDMTIARQVRELAAVRAFVTTTYAPRSWAMVGESFGATVGLRDPDPGYRAVVLLWPAIWLLDGAFESYVTEENLALARRQGCIEMESKEIGIDFLHELLAIRDVSDRLEGSRTPVLLVHGDRDAEVPFTQSVRASELVSGPVRLVRVPGGDHGLGSQSERSVVYRETVRWLLDHL